MIYSDIFQAARRSEIGQFKVLLDGANLNAVTSNNRNLLHLAIAYGKQDNALELIKRGINVNFQDENGETPLHYAASYNRKELVAEILNNGSDPSIVNAHGNTPLWNAVFNAKGNYEIVALFLPNKTLATLKNKHGRSPLDFAQQIGDNKLVGMLANDKND